MTRWEYTMLIDVSQLKQPELNRKLNELGEKRWELVTIFNNVAHFKRHVQYDHIRDKWETVND